MVKGNEAPRFEQNYAKIIVSRPASIRPAGIEGVNKYRVQRGHRKMNLSAQQWQNQRVGYLDVAEFCDKTK